jgi:hypothetical protein
MAIKKVIEIDVDQVQAMGGLDALEKSLKNTEEKSKSLKQQLREAVAEAQQLAEKYGATSKEAVEAAKKAADLKDKIEDTNDAIQAFKGEGTFIATSKALGAVASGATAAQGAINLLGGQSEATEEAILKIQSAMALTQGLEGLEDAGRAFSQLKTVAINAFNGIRNAIGSTGIGLLVIALGSLVAYWDDIKEAVGGVSDEQKSLNELSSKNLQIEQKKLNSIGEQDNILKLQGKTEKEILQSKIRQTDEVIKATELSIKNAEITLRAQIEAETRNKKILTGLLEVVQFVPLQILKLVDLLGEAIGKNFNLASRFKDFATGFIFDPEETRKEGEAAIQAQRDSLNKLKNDRAGFQLAINEIDKNEAKKNELTEAEKLKKLEELNKKYNDNLAKTQTDIDLADLQKAQDKINLDIANKEQEIALEQQHQLKIAQLNYDSIDAIEQREKESLELKRILREQELALVGDTLGKISFLLGKNSKAGKAFAIAQALINTYQGITAELATKAVTPYEIGLKVVNVAYIAKTGFDAVKKIASTSTSGSGGSGGSQSLGGGGGASATPQFNIVGQSSTNQLTATIAGQQNRPVQTYVVGSQVTSQQALDRNAQQNSVFG